MTQAQQALADGLAELTSQLGRTLTFAGRTFGGLISTPAPAEFATPRGLAYGQEYQVEITASPSAIAFAAGLPTAGDHFTAGSTTLHIVGTRHAPDSHLITFLCRLPTP